MTAAPAARTLADLRLSPPRQSRGRHLLLRAVQRLGLPERWQMRMELADFRAKAGAELQLLCALADPARIAVDVGAARGHFSATLLGCGCRVVAVEANPEEAARFARRLPDVPLHRVALSSATGAAQLRVPLRTSGALPGYGTIEPANRLNVGHRGVAEVEVPLRRLDDLGLPPVGLVKIDVEGHELEVLRGAAGILARDRPALQLEAEERHRPGAVASTAAFLAEFGYAGWVLAPEGLRSLDAFDTARDQTCGRQPYLNTFAFAAEPGLQARLDQAARAAASAR
jgi:FkbM family methyltransferase